jgi:hypothetical protein
VKSSQNGYQYRCLLSISNVLSYTDIAILNVTAFPAIAVMLTRGTSYTVPNGATTMKAWAVGGGASFSDYRGTGGGGTAYKTWPVKGGDTVTYSVGDPLSNGYGGNTLVAFFGAVSSKLTIANTKGLSTFTGSGIITSPYIRTSRILNSDSDGLLEYSFTVTANGMAYVSCKFYDDANNSNSGLIKKNGIQQGQPLINGQTITARSFPVLNGDVITFFSESDNTSFENVSIWLDTDTIYGNGGQNNGSGGSFVGGDGGANGGGASNSGGGAVGGNTSVNATNAPNGRNIMTDVSGLKAALALAGIATTQEPGSAGVFGSGGVNQFSEGDSDYVPGIGGGSIQNFKPFKGAVVLYFT